MKLAGTPCAVCDSKRVLLRADGSFIRCWSCRRQCGYIKLGMSGRWTPERHEQIKREAPTL